MQSIFFAGHYPPKLTRKGSPKHFSCRIFYRVIRGATTLKTGFLIAISWLFFSGLTIAQDAIPDDILARTKLIKIGNVTGTAFAVEHDQKMYLVTARHVAASLPDTPTMIQFRNRDSWVDIPVVKKLLPSAPEVDIAVLKTNLKPEKPFEIKVDSTSVFIGQQIWFLGYPYGLGSHFTNDKEAPFIKRGTMSAIDSKNPKAIILYIDGFNNPGFSGGPIVYWDLSKHVFKILGVVRGFREDSAKIVVNGTHVDTQILVNSGILVGYDIKHAMEAIESEAPR